MNKKSFFTAISGMYDAFLKGVATTGRDAACHVSTTMMPCFSIRKFAVACIAVLCLTGNVWADDAATIASKINAKTNPNITASASGNTVTVTDGITGGLTATVGTADNFLSFSINPHCRPSQHP